MTRQTRAAHEAPLMDFGFMFINIWQVSPLVRSAPVPLVGANRGHVSPDINQRVQWESQSTCQQQIERRDISLLSLLERDQSIENMEKQDG
jgi:hypothetical protein